MKIYLGYGYNAWTSGTYWEKALKKMAEVEFCGIGKESILGATAGFDIASNLKEVKNTDVFIYIDSGVPFFPRNIDKLRCLTACYLIDLHVDCGFRMELAKYFDLIFLAQKDYLEIFKAKGFKNVFWAPFGADPEIYRMHDLPKKFDIGFVGHLRSDNLKRNRLIELLSKKFIINDFHKTYTPEETSVIYSQSKMVFNCSAKGDLNMRVFEALSCGRMLLTDVIGNGLNVIFQDRKHLVIFRKEEELIALADYYLKNDLEREEIAKSGHNLILLNHTYEQRMKSVLEIITAQRSAKAICQAIFREKPAQEISRSLAKIYCHWQLISQIREELFKNNTLSAFIIKCWYLLKIKLQLSKKLLLKKLPN